MSLSIDRNRNTNDTADVKAAITVNNTTSVVLAAANLNRIFFEVNNLPKATDVCVFIRPYPAAQDTIRRGAWVGRFNFANDTVFRSFWRMPKDNIYTGEISAILLAGQPDEDVYVIEY